MIRQTVFLLACMTLLAGCVDFRYDGGTEAPGPDEVTVFNRADGVRRANRVFGRATVSGDYHEISRDRLIAKLKEEAHERGADAILITEQQVVPLCESRNLEPRFPSDASLGSDSLAQIRRDVEMNGPDETRPNARYVRVLKADFLKYTDGTAPKPAEVIEPAAAAETKKRN